MTDMQLFYILLGGGIVLLSAEIFIPGGILGAIGTLMLMTAIFLSLFVFEIYGVLIAFLILVSTITVFIVWLNIFPKTPIGRRVSLNKSLKTAKSRNDSSDLIGKRGVVVSELRPSGFVRIDGKKYDVLSAGDLIEKGKEVEVINVSGMRIVVKEV